MVDRVRILFCFECKTHEEIPWYEGDPKYDTLLTMAAAKHRFPSGEEHRGLLFDVPTKEWNHKPTRRAIQNQILEQTGLTGLDKAFYDTKNQFQEDAMTCWTRDHNRDPGCSDYMSEKKRLKPDTAAERRDLGLEVKNRPSIYLCQFCPVHSLVQQAANARNPKFD